MRQYELNLTPDLQCPKPVEPWQYRFTDKALVEDLGQTRYVYGLWEKLFGCWEVDTRTNISREIVPSWRLLNSTGVWYDVTQLRIDDPNLSDAHFMSKRWQYEANAAFAGLLSGIPQTFRSIVASLERHQWLALDMIWQHPEFAKFLDEEIYNSTQQFIFACFALSEAASFSRSRRRELAVAMMTRRRTDLLSELTGIRCGNSALRALYKLGSEPCSAGIYQALFECMVDERLATALSHSDRINPQAIEVLDQYRNDIFFSNVARIILSNCDDEGYVDLAMYNVQVINGAIIRTPPGLRNRALQSLSKARNASELLSRALRWSERLREFAQFPTSPIDRYGHLAPLTSPEAVRCEALEMQNCATTLITEILAQNCYLLHWNGEEAATVLIVREGGTNWKFRMALGFDNTPLSPETETMIKVFLEQGLQARQGQFLLENKSATNGE